MRYIKLPIIVRYKIKSNTDKLSEKKYLMLTSTKICIIKSVNSIFILNYWTKGFDAFCLVICFFTGDSFTYVVVVLTPK
jgi:hypothetical protein